MTSTSSVTVTKNPTPAHTRKRTNEIIGAIARTGALHAANSRPLKNATVHPVHAAPGTERAVVEAIQSLGWAGMGVTVTDKTHQRYGGHDWTVIEVRVPHTDENGAPLREFPSTVFPGQMATDTPEVPAADDRIDQPDHELIGKRVHGFFARHELPTVQAIGTVVRAYLSHEMNGRRAEMITVACDDGTERTATRFSVSVLPDETASGPYAPSQVGADLPEQGGLWEVIDTREPFGSYCRVVRTSDGAPKYWTMFEDAAGHADELNRALAAESSIIQPEHELIGKRVRGTFSNGTDPDVEVTGTVTSAYLSGEIHGFRLPMFTVQCDDGRRRFMSQGSVSAITDAERTVSELAEQFGATRRDGADVWGVPLRELLLRGLGEIAGLLRNLDAYDQTGPFVLVRDEAEANRQRSRLADLLAEHGESVRPPMPEPIGAASTPGSTLEGPKRIVSILRPCGSADGKDHEYVVQFLDPCGDDTDRPQGHIAIEHSNYLHDIVWVPAAAAVDTTVPADVALRAHFPANQVFGVYRVEFANLVAAGDTLLAEPFIASCADPKHVLDVIRQRLYSDDKPWTANIKPDFDVEEPDFDSGPVGGVVAISADESVNAFLVTKLATVELSPEAVLDFDDPLIGTQVVVSVNTRDFDPDGERFTGTVLMSYDDPMDPESAHTSFLAVQDDDGQIHIRWRRMVRPLRQMQDARLSLLLNTYAHPAVTPMSKKDRAHVLAAARLLDPNTEEDAGSPLPVLLGLNDALLWGLNSDAIRPVIEAARERLEEMLTAYEKANPMDDVTLSEGQRVYRYTMILPGTYEREWLTVGKANDDGTVNVRTAGGSFFRAEPGQFAGFWPSDDTHVNPQNVRL